jgi:3-phosphoshikimate 1-carboxyvinyltransferase
VQLCNIAKVIMSSIVRINGPAQVNGEITVPGDKSISHRAALLAAIANGASKITGFASSADCQATLDCIRKLGIPVQQSGGEVIIAGGGADGFQAAGSEPVHLWAGNSGSTIRMIAGLLAGSSLDSEIDGDPSLRRRPMRRIMSPLRLMGAQIEAREDNYPPLRIAGRPLRAIHFDSPVASAQIKTCVLLAGLGACGATVFTEPAQSRNHTELMLPEFGVSLTIDECGPGRRIVLEGGQPLRPVNYQVPGDLSSAAFFIAAALVAPGSSLAIKGVGLNPTRSGFLDVLDGLGGGIIRTNVRTSAGEPVGDLVAASSRLSCAGGATLLSGPVIANIIDEVPMLAVVATQVHGRLEVRGARELRIKESDRIRTVVEGITAMGGQIQEFDDGFAIEGPQRLVGARVSSHGDHRIAMAFAIAGLIANGTIEIDDADCAAVSFPEFYSTLERVMRN